eukprot:2348526-Rhodomonas_salina.1
MAPPASSRKHARSSRTPGDCSRVVFACQRLCVRCVEMRVRRERDWTSVCVGLMERGVCVRLIERACSVCVGLTKSGVWGGWVPGRRGWRATPSTGRCSSRSELAAALFLRARSVRHRRMTSWPATLGCRVVSRQANALAVLTWVRVRRQLSEEAANRQKQDAENQKRLATLSKQKEADEERLRAQEVGFSIFRHVRLLCSAADVHHAARCRRGAADGAGAAGSAAGEAGARRRGPAAAAEGARGVREGDRGRGEGDGEAAGRACGDAGAHG